MDPLASITLSTAMSVLLSMTALHKFTDRQAFAWVLATYQLVPRRLQPAFATLIPLAEASAAVLLLLDASRRLGATLATLLLVAFTLAMAVNLVRGRRDLDCGCGLSFDGRSESLSEALLARNAVLICAMGAVSFSVATRPAIAVDHFNGVLGGVLLALLFATAARLLATRRLMSARRL